MTETEQVEAIARELDIEISVTHDIYYLRCYEKAIVDYAKANPEVRSFPVFNYELEVFLYGLFGENKNGL